jgi:hypothetical protein
MKKLMTVFIAILFALSMTGLCFAQAPAAPAPTPEKKAEDLKADQKKDASKKKAKQKKAAAKKKAAEKKEAADKKADEKKAADDKK